MFLINPNLGKTKQILIPVMMKILVIQEIMSTMYFFHKKLKKDTWSYKGSIGPTSWRSSKREKKIGLATSRNLKSITEVKKCIHLGGTVRNFFCESTYELVLFIIRSNQTRYCNMLVEYFLTLGLRINGWSIL